MSHAAVRYTVCLVLLMATPAVRADVITPTAVTDTQTFTYDGQSVIVSTDVPPALIGTYWLKPAEFFEKLERRLTLNADGTVVTESTGIGGGPRQLTWGIRVENGVLRVTRYPGPVWMGSHEGENMPTYTLVLRYEDGRLEEKPLFESRDRLGVAGPGGMALIKNSGHSDRCACLRNQRAAIHRQTLASDMPSGFRGHQDRRTFQILFAAKTIERDALQHGVALGIQQALGHLRGEEAGAKRIDVDIVVAPLGRQRAGEVDHGAFAGVVGNGVHAFRIAGQAGDRGDVDDLAGLAGNHAALGDGLGEKEDRVDVQVHHLHPAFCRVFLGWRAPRSARVVDQDVDVPQATDHGVHHGGNGFQIGQVRSDG